MSKRYGGRLYSIEHFDRHLSLKPPLALMLCWLFLCRDLLFAVIGAASSMKGRGMDLGLLAAHEHRVFFAAGLVLALPVFGAYVHRAPDAGGAVRWLWTNGPLLLAASALVQTVPALLEVLNGGPWRAPFHSSPWMLIMSAAVAGYVLCSKRVRDTFSDFPEREAR